MNPVSSAELLSIQHDLSSAVCDQPCQIWRKTLTKDVYGTSTETWTLITTTHAGTAEPSGTQLQNYDYLIGSLNAWRVHLPMGTNVLHQDHLVISVNTMIVQVLLGPRSYPGLLALLATEVV